MPHSKLEKTPAAIWVTACFASVAVFVLARYTRLTFPFPWNDEARSFLPALWWAQHHDLRPLNVNAPQGVYWVPDGFSVLLGTVLRWFGETIQVARLATETMVSAAVGLLTLASFQITRAVGLGLTAALLIVTPPMVFAANMVRMEAPVVLLIAIAMLLHLSGKPLSAAALLWLSTVVHPACLIAAPLYTAFIFAQGRKYSWDQWVMASAVLIILFAELWHIVQHADLFKSQMAYQSARKIGRSPLKALTSFQGALAVADFLALAALWRLTRQRVLSSSVSVPVALMASGLMLYAVFGQEMAYDVYSLALVQAFVLALVARHHRMMPGYATVI